MIKISRLADYAVVILATMARSESERLSAAEISGLTGLPEPTVAKVLKNLSRQDLVESIRGAHGGYKMLKAPEDIEISAVIAAVDGPIMLTACVEPGQEDCDYAAKCSVKGRWNDVNEAVISALKNVSLSDMAFDAPPDFIDMKIEERA